MALTGADVQPRDFPTNRGGLCQKGWTSGQLLTSPVRLTSPLLHGRPVSWDTALDFVVDRITRIQRDHGRDGVAVFGGGGLTNEKAYLLGKFARVALGTSRIDYNGRFCMASAAAAGNRAFGVDRGMPFPVTDLDDADTILLLGSNVAATMPPFIGHLAAARASGGLIVVDPRRSQTAQLTAEGGGMHVQPAPGTDLVVLLGLLHLVLAEGLADEASLAERTNGFDAVRRTVAPWWPERVQEHTGVPVGQLREVARRLARGRGTYILTGRGVEQHVDGTDTATAAINLALVLGLVGRPASGYGTLTGQGNGQGGREHGQKADQLPGYRKITDPAARAHVAGVWGIDPDDLPGPGRSAFELLDALGTEGGVRTLLLMASNVAVSAPDARRVLSRLGDLDFLTVSDFFLSETAELADVVLPSAMWAEEAGTMTNLEGRVIRRRRALDPPAGVPDDLQLLATVAGRLGAGHLFSGDPETVFEELRRASAGGTADYSGISYRRIEDEQGVFWPCPSPEPPGTPRLFTDRFATPDGRARFLRVEHVDAHEPTDADYPYVLTTGRVLAQYQSGTQTRRTRSLSMVAPTPRAELPPALARRLGIGPDD